MIGDGSLISFTTFIVISTIPGPVVYSSSGLSSPVGSLRVRARGTVLSRKVEGEGRLLINNVLCLDDNSTCRKCRFDRCVAVGMEYEGPLRKPRKQKEVKIEMESSSSSTDQVRDQD